MCPEYIDFKRATFWDRFRAWVIEKKYAGLRDMRLRFKMYFLRPDWWEDDEAIDKDVSQTMKKLNLFLDKVKLMDETEVEDMINNFLGGTRDNV